MTDNNNQVKLNRTISLGMLAIAAVLALIIIIKAAAFIFTPVGDTDLFTDPPVSTENGDDNQPSKSLKLAEQLKKKNMFVPPPPQPGAPEEVRGIFGKEALINSEWYKVGDTIPPGAKVVSINASHVKILWQGKEITLAPIKAASSPGPRKSAEKKPPERKTKDDRPKNGSPQKEVQPENVKPAEIDDLAWLDIPADLKEKFRKLWNNMTDEQKKQFKEQWNKMTDEQKKQAIEAWKQHL